MADYKEMYLTLFNKITDVLEELEGVQQMAEDMYINEKPAYLSTLANTANYEKSARK
ncbi:hypothetical protein [Ethanoligenens harbinense]|uniref:Uncharacterized protein n=1 Tax=Ethanoligenens harbinense (strain DSM 18485 / JCM 12961 / CGMCC 1.5033 / YUAN-3) TaxID=663278 RepID=E6U465_ETHHY|nr:hypothetical protein [Ethanoligenens harbinense]ADU26565.1 hypothetical protein Ethha_1012 [Ethanoligenens harbinense YUAN-3]